MSEQEIQVVTRNKLTDIEVMRQYFEGEREEEQLTAHQLLKREKINTCYSMLIDGQPNSKIIKKMMTRFNISKVQAYREINDTEIIWGPLRKGNKEMKRQIAENMALKAYRLAEKKKDQKGMTAATKAYSDASGINQFDPELPDFEKIQPDLIIMVVPPEVEALVKQLLAGGAVNLNQFPQSPTIDIDHEEVNDAERE